MIDGYVQPETLRELLAGERPPTVIDVRSREEDAAGHIPGARHVPGDRLAARLDEIPRVRPVVTYRNMRHRGASRGEGAAALLRGSGFEAAALEGGFPAWAAAGLPVERIEAGTVRSEPRR